MEIKSADGNLIKELLKKYVLYVKNFLKILLVIKENIAPCGATTKAQQEEHALATEGKKFVDGVKKNLNALSQTFKRTVKVFFVPNLALLIGGQNIVHMEKIIQVGAVDIRKSNIVMDGRSSRKLSASEQTLFVNIVGKFINLWMFIIRNL